MYSIKYKESLLFVFALVILPLVQFAQNVPWSAKKDFSYRTWVKKVCADKFGNLFSLSTFEKDYNNSSSGSGFALSMHDSTGNLIWEKILYNSVAYTNGYDLTCDSSGNLYALGNTGDSVIINNITISARNGISFLLKFNSPGVKAAIILANTKGSFLGSVKRSKGRVTILKYSI